MTSPFPFQFGSVLQAQQLNDITNLPINDQTASYSLVVGDAGKRVVMNVATANTVTVDDDIFTTGDTIFVANKGAGASTLTAGAGVTINSASGLVLVEHQSGQLVALSASSFLFVLSAGPAPAAGLELISTTTIGSAVSTVTVTGAFSATHDNYLITIVGGVSTTSQVGFLQLGASTTGYFASRVGVTYSSGAVTSGAISNVSNFAGSFMHDENQINGNYTLYGPNLAKRTFVSGYLLNSNTGQSSQTYGGFLNDATQHTAFTVGSGGGATMTGGTIRVYGYKN